MRRSTSRWLAQARGPSMWWTIAAAVVVLLGVIITLIIIVLPRFRIMQQLIDRLNLVARENLSGLLVIRAFNMQSFEEERFDRANEDLAATTLFIGRAMGIMMPVMMLIIIPFILAYTAWSYYVFRGKVKVGHGYH